MCDTPDFNFKAELRKLLVGPSIATAVIALLICVPVALTNLDQVPTMWNTLSCLPLLATILVFVLLVFTGGRADFFLFEFNGFYVVSIPGSILLAEILLTILYYWVF